MPQFDADRMLKLVSQMREAVNRLRVLRECERSVFVRDPDKSGSAKYHLIVAIESAIDMCNHLISRNGYRAPDDYADTFAVLGEQGAFEQGFLERLKEMARFQNRLVHLYWEIDENQVYRILQERLGDFKVFLDRLATFLNWPELA